MRAQLAQLGVNFSCSMRVAAKKLMMGSRLRSSRPGLALIIMTDTDGELEVRAQGKVLGHQAVGGEAA